MSLTTTPTAKSPAPGGSSVVPFPSSMWGGSFPPGCCPPGGMDSLMKCYCDIQAATQFITAIMIDAINNNPAVAEAIIAAIQKSGSNLPLIGVTNGADAQPGQVGEWVMMTQYPSYPAGSNTQAVTMGVLQPGDWDCWARGDTATPQNSAALTLNPMPAGFVPEMTFGINTTGEWDTIVVPPVRALISVPTLINFSLTTVPNSAAGQATIVFIARRRR